MKNRKSPSRSQQPSPQPSLQSAQRSEKHEDEVDLENAKLLMVFFQAIWDEHDAQRNSTTEEELPQMETGKEVTVRPVNPSLGNQDGEERVNSIAYAVEVNDPAVGIENEGEGTEKLTGQAIGELPGASNQHPMLIGSESEPDSELPTTIHPSSAPEGSLLQALYLQLLGAGRGGITLRELFKCLKEPAEELNFGGDWKVQVRTHLKTNPHFHEAKGLYHYVMCDDQFQVQQPSNKCSPANIASTSRCYGASSSQAVLPSQHLTPAAVHTGLSVDKHEDTPGVVRPRRKAFDKAMAALSEQAAFEEMHQSMAAMQMPSSVADPADSQLVSHGPLSPSSKKRKSSPSHGEELAHHGHPVAGGLQATQAEILVETSQRCVVLRDEDTGNWRCNNMAMAGHTLCKHHMSLQVQEDSKASLSPNPGSPLIAPDSPEAGVQTSVQCGHRHKSKDGTRSLQCSSIAMEGHRLCEHHKQRKERRKERRKARKRADAQQGKQGAASLQHNQDSGSILGLPESRPNLNQSLLPLHTKSAAISPRISHEDTLGHTEAAKNVVDKPATGVPNLDDDSNGEQLQQQMPKNGLESHHVAARKTAANEGPLKFQGLIQAPTIPPLPPLYGIRRNTPTGEE